MLAAPGNGAWQARYRISSDRYQALTNSFTPQGYSPLDVSRYEENGLAMYAALWERPGIYGEDTWVSRHGLTNAQCQAAFDSYTSQ